MSEMENQEKLFELDRRLSRRLTEANTIATVVEFQKVFESLPLIYQLGFFRSQHPRYGYPDASPPHVGAAFDHFFNTVVEQSRLMGLEDRPRETIAQAAAYVGARYEPGSIGYIDMLAVQAKMSGCQLVMAGNPVMPLTLTEHAAKKPRRPKAAVSRSAAKSAVGEPA